MRKIDDAKRRKIIELRAAGLTMQAIADAVGVSKATVSVVSKKTRLAKTKAKKQPKDRGAKELRDRLLAAAHKALDHVEEQLESGSVQSQPMVAVGIATQRFLEAQAKLAAVDGLPEQLPDDDDDARRAVLQGWWQAARLGNAPAMQHLAEALGLQRANRQPIVVTFEDDDAQGGAAT